MMVRFNLRQCVGVFWQKLKEKLLDGGLFFWYNKNVAGRFPSASVFFIGEICRIHRDTKGRGFACWLFFSRFVAMFWGFFSGSSGAWCTPRVPGDGRRAFCRLLFRWSVCLSALFSTSEAWRRAGGWPVAGGRGISAWRGGRGGLVAREVVEKFLRRERAVAPEAGGEWRFFCGESGLASRRRGGSREAWAVPEAGSRFFGGEGLWRGS